MATPAAQLRAKAALIQPRVRLEVALRRVLGPDYRMGFLFVAPIVILVLALVAYPFCYAVYLSMTRKYVGMAPVWVGFENYVRLTYDGFFQRAVVNSFTSPSPRWGSSWCWAWGWRSCSPPRSASAASGPGCC